MKRFRFASLTVLLVMLAMLLQACATVQPTPTVPAAPAAGAQPAPAPAKQTKLLRWPTSSSTAGSGYIYSSAVATLANKYGKDHGQPVDITVTTSAGVFENERLMGEGQADIILHSSNEIWNSYKGLGKFEGKANPNLRVLFRGYASYLNIIASEKSGINSLADLKGKRLSAGPPGSVAYTMGETLLGAYGLTYKDMTTRPLSLDEQMAALKDGTVDAIMIVQGMNVPGLKDMANSTAVRWINFEEPKWQELSKTIPTGYYSLEAMPKGTYKGQDSDVNMVGLSVIWATTTKLDNDAAYAIVKSFFENKAEADKIHPIIKSTTPAFAALNLPVPLHSGAEKYFKEAGVIK